MQFHAWFALRERDSDRLRVADRERDTPTNRLEQKETQGGRATWLVLRTGCKDPSLRNTKQNTCTNSNMYNISKNLILTESHDKVQQALENFSEKL